MQRKVIRARIVGYRPIIAKWAGASSDRTCKMAHVKRARASERKAAPLSHIEENEWYRRRAMQQRRTAESRLRVDSHGLGLYRLSGERKITRPVRSGFESERDLVVSVPPSAI